MPNFSSTRLIFSPSLKPILHLAKAFVGIKKTIRQTIREKFIKSKNAQFKNSSLLSKKIDSSVDSKGFVNGGIFNYVKVKRPTIA